MFGSLSGRSRLPADSLEELKSVIMRSDLVHGIRIDAVLNCTRAVISKYEGDLDSHNDQIGYAKTLESSMAKAAKEFINSKEQLAKAKDTFKTTVATLVAEAKKNLKGSYWKPYLGVLSHLVSVCTLGLAPSLAGTTSAGLFSAEADLDRRLTLLKMKFGVQSQRNEAIAQPVIPSAPPYPIATEVVVVEPNENEASFIKKSGF